MDFHAEATSEKIALGWHLDGNVFIRDGARHLPAAIVRPSVIVGDSQTGWTQAFNVIYWPLQAFARGLFPSVPDAHGRRVSNTLPLVGRWKIFDNLRRSLVAPSIAEGLDISVARFGIVVAVPSAADEGRLDASGDTVDVVLDGEGRIVELSPVKMPDPPQRSASVSLSPQPRHRSRASVRSRSRRSSLPRA